MVQDAFQCTELHAFNFSLQTRPIGAIERLHSALIPFSKPFTLPIRHFFYPEQNQGIFEVFLLQEGFFSICRQSDSLHMASGFAPSVAGLVDGYSSFYKIQCRPRHYIVAETECRGFTIPVSVFAAKVDEFGLWYDVAEILAQRVMVMSAREHELIGSNAYTKIRALLIELWLYPAEVRNQFNVQNFIQMRTAISHSQIMKILSGLKIGQYIDISRGKLIELRKLPHFF